MSERFEAETLHGKVVIEFGVNRWVLVTIGSSEGQNQIDSREELASYLRTRGLSEREADEFSQEAWTRRPPSAADHVATSNEGLVGAMGLSSGKALVLIVALVVAAVLITLYAFVLPH